MALDLTAAPQAAAPAKTNTRTGLAAIIRSKIANTLSGKKGEQFVTDVVSLVNSNPALGSCDPVSLIAACLQAQTLKLSLNRNMGQAWVVPFEDRRHGRTTATFQIGYKGYVQLAIRSGQYRKLNVLAIKEGELTRWDPLLEDIEVELIADEEQRAKTETCGYYAMFEYTNGFRKALYWSRAKMEQHALQYSQAFRTDRKKGWQNSFWSKDFDSMAVKTMLRQLISKWGIMSVDMQNALEADGKLSDGSYADGMVLDASFAPATDTMDAAPAETVDPETGEVSGAVPETEAKAAPAPAEEKKRGKKKADEQAPQPDAEPDAPLPDDSREDDFYRD